MRFPYLPFLLIFYRLNFSPISQIDTFLDHIFMYQSIFCYFFCPDLTLFFNRFRKIRTFFAIYFFFIYVFRPFFLLKKNLVIFFLFFWKKRQLFEIFKNRGVPPRPRGGLWCFTVMQIKGLSNGCRWWWAPGPGRPVWGGVALNKKF